MRTYTDTIQELACLERLRQRTEDAGLASNLSLRLRGGVDTLAFLFEVERAEGNEEKEARSFWIELCSEVLGIANPTHVLDFERRAHASYDYSPTLSPAGFDLHWSPKPTNYRASSSGLNLAYRESDC